MITISVSKYRAAIFDMDGTMIDNMAYHKKAWQEFLKRHKITLSEEEFKTKISGKKNDRIFEIVFGKMPSAQTLHDLTEEKESVYREIYSSEIKEIQGLSDIIGQLQEKGIRLAIATTAPKKNRDFALEALNLLGKFEVILGDEDVSNGKPHPEIYLAAASRLGVSPADCIVFEDSPPGVASAKQAGMSVVAILSSHTEQDLADADYSVNNYSEISLP